MTFDASKGRTNVTALEFTYEVAAGDLSTQGIAFNASKLSVGTNASIRKAGTQEDANLAFAAVDHNSAHKVDGVLPALIGTDPVSVTSSAGTDATYAIGDAIDITATFDEAVTVTTAGTPVAGPRVAFTVGTAVKHAVYHSGSGTTALVFRYTVTEGDGDDDGISIGEDATSLNGGTVVDAVGNAATATQLEHSALAALAGHKVDGVRPTVTGAVVSGTALRVVFSETLGAAASLANGAFTVRKTPQSGTETNVGLGGSPAINGNTLTLTLASTVLQTDSAVKVSYAKPTTGTGNRLVDAPGNEAESFANVAVTLKSAVSEVKLISAPAPGQNDTYRLGDTVRARVTFGAAVDVVGSPVLKLDFDLAESGGEKSMTFDASGGRTGVKVLEFTYTVAAGDLSAKGIGFDANKLSAGQGVSIRSVGTQEDADLSFAKVGHNAAHKVDGVLPALIATDPVSVTSSAGTDATYAIGDAIDITATFDEAVTVTTAGTPVAGPRVAFTVGTAVKHAVYHSGSGTTALVFRYSVTEGDADADGISVGADALSLNGGTIADAAGNAAPIEHSALAALTGHKVDGVRPTVTGARTQGTAALKVAFSEPLGAAASLANGAFAVKKNGSAVSLSGSPAVNGKTLTLTLASAVAATDTVTISYVKPTAGTGNRLVDAVGNEAASFANATVTFSGVSAVELVSTPAVGQNDTYKLGDTVRARVTFDTAVDVAGNPVLKLDLDPAEGGEKSMTFDATKGRTNVTALEFTWTVAAGDLSTRGIGFGANMLSVGSGVSIRKAGTSSNVFLAFPKVDHDPAQKVDGILPALVATNPISVTSSAGPDKTYVRGEAIDTTVTFTEPVTVTTAGNPVSAPNLLMSVGSLLDFRSVLYHSGSGTNKLVFRYTVAAGDRDPDGVEVHTNGLTTQTGGFVAEYAKIADAAGNNIATPILHKAVSPRPNHKVDGSLTVSDTPRCSRALRSTARRSP